MDYKAPEYTPIFAERERRLLEIRKDPTMLPNLKAYYREHPAQFISDWGVTVDPRNVERGLPSLLPFVLFPKQIEWIEWIVKNWKEQKYGITEKSRDMGISWCAVALSATMCLLYKGMAIGFGSRKEEYVDKLGDPKCLFYKARMFIQYLPVEFRGGWDIKKHAPHMRIMFPETESIIAGEAGDDIGRGDRKSIYFVDEAAHLERPQLADASLSATTNCRQDLSSVKGMANPFAEKRHSGKHRVFTFHWRDDPRKDDAWYQDQCDKLDAVTVAQEIDINYSASVEGIVIPAAWVNAALDIHLKLKIEPTGARDGSLDVADQGIDKNAFAARKGLLLEFVKSWKGKDSDLYETTERAFGLCDEHGIPGFCYDADGLGASIRGDARKINEGRGKVSDLGRSRESRPPTLAVRPFRGSSSGDKLYQPEAFVRGLDGTPLDRKNKDFFANYKAQSWWALRYRFNQTYRASKGMPFDPDDIISINSDFPERARCMIELSQPVYLINGAGKILIDKQPEGVSSPNLGDAVMMLYAPRRAAFNIDPALLEDLEQ